MLDLSFYPLCQPGLMRGWGFICISEVSLNAAIMMIGLFKLRSVYGKKNKTPKLSTNTFEPKCDISKSYDAGTCQIVKSYLVLNKN